MLQKLSTMLIFLFLTTAVSANNHEEAKELFKDADCMSCHNDEDFAPKEKVSNFHQLQNVVDACRFGNDADWFDDESLDVVRYLNDKYYKFKEQKK